MKKIYSIIKGTGTCIPTKVVKNSDFIKNNFCETNGIPIDKPGEEIVQKFEDITTIQERRYAEDHQNTSDLALIAAENALEAAGVDRETLDYIIVAHNFGETANTNNRVDSVPSIAARVKQKLKIANPRAVAYDVLFGCPGWVQAVIQADYYIRSGDAKNILVIGADILSRVSDPHDRDGMIYADGAGAVVLQGIESETPVGILGHGSRTDALDYAQMLYMGCSNEPTLAQKENYFLKMNGRRLYHYAISHVPTTLKEVLDRLNLPVEAVSKVLIHQANGKMDDAILERFYKLYGKNEVPEGVMPMTISWLGNSSVATIPTLLDVIIRGGLENQELNSNDLVLFASVGAGMSINAVAYKFP